MFSPSNKWCNSNFGSSLRIWLLELHKVANKTIKWSILSPAASWFHILKHSLSWTSKLLFPSDFYSFETAYACFYTYILLKVSLLCIIGPENLVDLAFYPWKGMKMLMQQYVQLIRLSGMVGLFLWKNQKRRPIEAFYHCRRAVCSLSFSVSSPSDQYWSWPYDIVYKYRQSLETMIL